MKKSTLLLTIGAVTLTVLLLAVVLVVRIDLGSAFASSESQKQEFERAMEGFDANGKAGVVNVELRNGESEVRYLVPGETVDLGLSGFRSVSVQGGWTVKLIKGDSFSVKLTAPNTNGFFVRATNREDGLNFSLTARGKGAWNESGAVLEITMPVLESVESLGGAAIDLSGFECESLGLELSGGGVVHAADLTARALNLEVTGGWQIDMADARVSEATIEASGAGAVSLHIDGGSLDGRLDGAFVLSYGGNPASVELSTTGVSSVRRAN